MRPLENKKLTNKPKEKKTLNCIKKNPMICILEKSLSII